MAVKKPVALYGGKLKELNNDDIINTGPMLYKAFYNGTTLIEFVNTTGATCSYSFSSGYNILTFSSGVLTEDRTHVQVTPITNNNGDGTVKTGFGYLFDGTTTIKVLTIIDADISAGGSSGLNFLGVPFSITIEIFPNEEE